MLPDFAINLLDLQDQRWNVGTIVFPCSNLLSSGALPAGVYGGVPTALCERGLTHLRRACSPFRTLLVNGWDSRLPSPVGMATLRGSGLGLTSSLTLRR